MRRRSAAAEALPLLRRPLRQLLKLAPFSRSSVSPRALRLRDCNTWKSPDLKLPDWILEPRPVALASSTVPFLVSRKEPTGTWRASVSGTNVRPF